MHDLFHMIPDGLRSFLLVAVPVVLLWKALVWLWSESPRVKARREAWEAAQAEMRAALPEMEEVVEVRRGPWLREHVGMLVGMSLLIFGGLLAVMRGAQIDRWEDACGDGDMAACESLARQYPGLE